MRHFRRFSVWWILFGSLGCSDYFFNNKAAEAEDGEDHHASGSSAAPLPLDLCDAQATEAPSRVTLDETCRAGGTPELEVVVEWSMTDFESFEYPEYRETLMTPVVGQLTDDNQDGSIDATDVPDIVIVTDRGANAGNFHGVLRILDGQGTGVHLTVNHVTYENTDYHPYQYTNVAIGDIDNDGLPEIVMVAGRLYQGGPGDPDPPEPEDSGDVPPDPDSGDADDTGMDDTGGDSGENPVRDTHESPCRVVALTHDGQFEWALDDVEIACGGHAPALGDLDGDGSVEVILGNLVIDGATGALLHQVLDGIGTFMAYPEIGYHSFPADLNGDGQQEIVTGKSIQDAQGNRICVMENEEDGFPGVADLDGDGQGEVVSVGEGRVNIFNGSCGLRSTFALAGTGNGGPPTLADMDGDGEVEIGVADASRYAVYEADGTVLWSHPVEDESSHATGSSVFDFDGDGSAEILYGDETAFWIFDGATGTVRYTTDSHTSRTLHEYPVVADVDGDGEAEVLVVNGGGHGDTEHWGVFVLGSADHDWRPARTVWNQHAYSITNIDENLEVPSPVPANWPTYNSFRSGSLTNGVDRLWVDAVPVLEGVCTDECDNGQAELIVRLGNSGTQEMPAGIPLTIYALIAETEHTLATLTTTDPIPPGQTTSGYRLSIDPNQVTGATLRLVADDDGTGAGTIEECNEDNNVWVVTEAICP